MDPIKNKIDVQDSLINKFKKFTDDYSDELLDKIFEYIDKFARSKGFLVLEAESGFLLAEFAKKLVEDFKESKYIGELGSLLGSFDELEVANKNLLGLLNPEFDFDALNFSKEKKVVIGELTESLLRPESFKVNISNEVRKILARNVLQGGSIKNLKKELTNVVSKSNTDGGILGRYVGQITTDAVLQYGGIINDKVAKIGVFNAFGYTGSLIETSRIQCQRWKNDKKGVLLFDQKESPYGYLPDEIKWANANGTGYGRKGSTSYIELTKDNFARYRGGYNCRHEALPFQWNDRNRKYYEKLNTEFEKLKT
jgi:hypothetical protein